ncbi:MAG: site-specific integrase, partial [Eubacterium sp.]|nr:site-specific integrase [Eubacterium sp.]
REEYQSFSDAIADKPISYYAFELLYWTGIRLGELLALTKADFNFKECTLKINKSYQRIKGEDVITEPKTKKSIRTINLPKFLCIEMKEFFDSLYGVGIHDRLFVISKSYLHHEIDRGVKISGVKRIRVHDLRHSHVSLLIDMGYSALAISERLGHEAIDITLRYAHLFPTVQSEMAEQLNKEKEMMLNVRKES